MRSLMVCILRYRYWDISTYFSLYEHNERILQAQDQKIINVAVVIASLCYTRYVQRHRIGGVPGENRLKGGVHCALFKIYQWPKALKF